MIGVEDLLRGREARGLRWGITVRLVIIAMGALMLPATSTTVADAVYTALLLATGAVISVYAYRLAKREERLARAGWMCLSFDLVTLVTLPVSWYQAAGGAEISPSFLLKNDFVPVCLMLIAANGLTLRWVYPLVVAGASLLLYGGFVAYGYGDPRMVFSVDIPAAVLGASVHPGFLAWRLATLAFFGGLFSWMAAASHGMVREAVELEHANAEMRRRQGELVMQGRIAALAGLVAGVAHEINSPLGVVRSCVQTMGSCGKKLEQGPNERALAALDENVKTAGEAAERIGGLVHRLKDFAGLDQADVQEMDVGEALDRTVELVDAATKGAVRVARSYGGAVSLRCRAREIHQVFFTLISNAFQAMGGEGELRMGTERRDGWIVVEIADTGRGMDAAELAELFEIRFAAKGERVGMGLGLPMARSIVESHGGAIEVKSEAGRGTVFEIMLPAK